VKVYFNTYALVGVKLPE